MEYRFNNTQKTKTMYYPGGEACLVNQDRDEEFWKDGVDLHIPTPHKTSHDRRRKQPIERIERRDLTSLVKLLKR